jgi:cell division transport system ATP-binding protein
MIALDHVCKSFGKRKVLENVTLKIHPREFVCLVGPSGAGKSTLIHLLIGAEEVTSGRIEVDGVELRQIPAPVMQLYRRRIGVVFQDGKLIENRTVAENIAFPLEVCGTDDAIIARRTKELLTRMELMDVAHALPRELSGGELARTAIARALVHEPMVLLADEPTGNLDPRQSLKVLELFQDIHRRGATVLLATHDSALVEMLQTRVVLLENGRIIRDASGGYPQFRSPPKSQENMKKMPSPRLENPPPTHQKKKIKVTAIHS